MAEIRFASKGARGGGRALTGGPGVSVTEGGGALTELAQRQGTWALTGRARAQGARARSDTHGPGRAIRIGRRGSDRGGVNGCGRRCSSPRR
jgi:hypothetical protein